MNTKNEARHNASVIFKEVVWLEDFINKRLNCYFDSQLEFMAPEPIHLTVGQSKYSDFILENELLNIERFIIVVCLALHFKPKVFDKFLIKNKALDKRFTEFGGKIDESKSIFVPTLETIAFIFYGDCFESRFLMYRLFDEDHLFSSENVIELYGDNSNSFLSNSVRLSDEHFQYFTIGTSFNPSYSSNFPASKITTSLKWEDLVLDKSTLDEVSLINTWIDRQGEILERKDLEKKINKGYKCLFYGSPGTGKTLTAILIGKQNNKSVYRIDLSQIVSKYIGETEKNLAKIFDIAENKNWILFFDEAESLFSKRTGVQDSKDKYANQQTAYLLQRIENYKGLIILATNLKPNIDVAFSRRIQSVVNFSVPGVLEREKLWKFALSGISNLPDSFIKKISSSYEISGGLIKNIIQYAWLISKQHNVPISEKEILSGIRRELSKDGKSFNNQIA
ncbi:ATP-binding protein [Psychroflexus planctonicus]|uniref:AAA+ ATPase domain-containing protein n=1 Tax=Psychroflexus planctonicus TaxID=1526575 RepID=A0ABQ1SKE6_9FLAO|nr:ATP-binding protein [Psychroflexus planctonicus]GGE41087.1 hypothetical protein GCM10010832_21430 [Psychroflexus planctonicus]